MKTIKFRLYAMLFLMVCSTTFVACSDDSSEATIDQQDIAARDGKSEIATYCDSIYGSNNYELGKTTDIDAGPYILTELTIDGDSGPRGYAVTDKYTEDFLYFIDVDRTAYEMRTFDAVADIGVTYLNIDTLDEYYTTDEFDFSTIAGDANTTPAEKFWGTDYSQGPCDPVTGLAQVYEDYYVCWIRVKHEPAAGMDNGPMYEPCGMH